MLAPTFLPDRSASLCHWCQPKNCGPWILWRDLEHRCPEKTVTPSNSGHVVGYKTWGINMLTSPMRSSWPVYRNHYMSFLAKKLLYVDEFLLFPPVGCATKHARMCFLREKLWYLVVVNSLVFLAWMICIAHNLFLNISQFFCCFLLAGRDL